MMELLPSHSFSTLVRDHRRGVGSFFFFLSFLAFSLRLVIDCQKKKNPFFSSFLQSFQSSKKTWMFTWACSSSSSPPARVGGFPSLSLLSALLLCRTHQTAPTGPNGLFSLWFSDAPPHLTPPPTHPSPLQVEGSISRPRTTAAGCTALSGI